MACVLVLFFLQRCDAQGQEVGESCAADADCYDTSANWCHSETSLCAPLSDTGGACATDSHCKYGRGCLGGYCCDYDADDLDYSLPYCTACTPRTDITSSNMREGPCTACEEGSWLDVSEMQEEIDEESEWNEDFEDVIADFGVCRKSCTADEFQDGTGCTVTKSAGQVCGEFSHNFRPGTSSDQCASGLCGGSYCCDEAAVFIACSKPCDVGTGACTTTVQVGESCAADADCYDTSANWCHSETSLCAPLSDTGGACATDSHCKYGRGCLGGYCCDYDADDLDYSLPYCTACTPRTDITSSNMREGPCTACEEGSWLDVSEMQEEIDEESEWNEDFEDVIADFGVCRKSCTADEFQDGTGCTVTKSAGQVCGEFSHNFRPGTSSDQCASGLCGGSYCCDDQAMRAVFAQNSECCTLCSNSGACVATSACPCDVVAPSNGALGDCTNSLASGSTCQPTCNSWYTVSGTSSCSAGTLTAAICSHDPCVASSISSKDGSDGSFYCINGGTVGGVTGLCNCTSCDAGYEGMSCHTVIPSPPPPLVARPPPPSSVEGMIANAEAKTEQAEVSRDALLADIGDENTKAKAKLLADAAIAGVKVKKVAMALTAESEDAACAQAFSKMQLDASLGACDAAVSTSRRRRLVANTAYDVTVFVSPTTVDETALAAALVSLATEGVTATSTETDPLEELRAIPGIDESSLESFAAAAAVAGEATSAAREAETTWVPPPPSPQPPVSPPPPSPPPRLVLNDYESSPATSLFSVMNARAIILCAMIAVLW
jgi:hypothetical protein